MEDIKMGFTVIIDNKEKSPWDFSFDDRCNNVTLAHLKEGDYTTQEILDLEESTGRKILRIERKASTNEIAANLGRLSDAFYREMERLAEYEYKYLILEFDLHTLLEFPKGSGIPKKFWYKKNKQGKYVKNIKMSGKFMEVRLDKISDDYGVQIIYAGNKEKAAELAADIFEKVYYASKD